VTVETSEWLKIMLAEIARKKVEQHEMLVEEQRRRGDAKACGDSNTCDEEASA
jgi:hypothetical protein